jgi:hypothetical protein
MARAKKGQKHMNEFEIYFDDLTPEAQQRLLEAFGIESP